MNKFHRRCGDRVTLMNQSLTAARNFVEFNHGLILGADPLIDDVMFEVRIDRKVSVWNGSLEIGVTTLDPEFMELPATATKLRNTAWILSGNSIVKDGVSLIDDYGPELDSLREGDCVGVTRTSKGELMFFINGRCLGVAATDLPPRLFAVIDLYGQCVQVSIMHNDYSAGTTRVSIDTMDEIEEYVEDGEDQQQDEAAAWAEPTETRDTRIQMPIVCPLVSQDHIRFHPRCGILVKLSCNNKTAERSRPLDDYNNGVVMTHRPLHDNELFEIRIDKLVDKWSGSIEVGVTTHNPTTIRFPSTMTNMDSGTIMMSGCKVLINGHGTCMEYGNFNLDELREGDTVGMMRKSNGKLHYFINGIDQGVATDKVASQVWGVIDLYGMTVKVTIVDPCEDLDSNINMPMGARGSQLPSTSSYRPVLDEETLLFHALRDSNVIIVNDGKTAHRPNAFEYFNNGVVMTNRTLKTNELFQVRLDLVIPKWAGSIEIGVTRQSSKDIKFPFIMSNETSGTWAITGEDVIRDGTIIIPEYVRNLNTLVEGDTIGVMRKDLGILHFFINGIDQGPAAFNIPEHVFGIIDLYGRVAQATIVDMYMPPSSSSPESPISSESNVTVFPEMCFHRVHGDNARLSRHRLTASRSTVYSEFNNAVLFSSRPLRECDMFEIRIDKMVDCWIGSLEIGVTAIRPEELEENGGVGAFAGTATDLSWDTYILSGSAMMKDGECVRSGYPLDLDNLTVGSRVGMMWHADGSVHYYLDGMDMGKAWFVPHLEIYAVVDLYGQCAQVSIVQVGDRNYNYNGYSGEQYIMNRRKVVITPPPPYWSFSEYCAENIVLRNEYSVAHRMHPDPMGAIVFSSYHLSVDEIYEIQIYESKYIYAGSFRMGVTDVNILNANVNRHFPLTISWLPHFTAYIDGRYLKYSKPGSQKQEVHSFVPSFEWLRPGDRVGFKKTADSRVLIYYNSELLDSAFEKVPDKVYVVCELGGHITMIKSVVRGTSVVKPQQQTIKNDDGPIMQQSSSTNANATDNATGHSAIISESETIDAVSGLISSEAMAAAMLDTTAEQGDEQIPVSTLEDPVSEPSRLDLDSFFEQLSPNNDEKQEYLPSAPTMAAIETPTTPEPFDEADQEEPQPNNDANNEVNVDEAGEAAAAAPAEFEPIAGPSNVDTSAIALAERRRLRPLPYTFHYVHGSNIRLCSSDTVAMRVRGYADGIAIASQPLRRGNHFRFRVDRIAHEWFGTLCIGAVAVLPNDDLPRSALHLECPAWILTNDLLLGRGRYTMTNFGRFLNDIIENSVMTLYFKFNSQLVLEVDGTSRVVIGVIPKLYNHVFPTIDLYGKVTQVSILLHPHVIVGGNSLDLPVIEENHEDDQATSPDDEDGYGGDNDDDDETSDNIRIARRGNPSLQQLNEWRERKRANINSQNDSDDSYTNNPRPGPNRRPDCLPGLPNANDVLNHRIKWRQFFPDGKSLHHSLILPNEFDTIVSDNDEAARHIFGMTRSLSTEQFRLPGNSDSGEEDDDDDDSQNSLANPLSLGSRMGDDDDTLDTLDTLDVPEICDTNIRHNDRYPEASDVDLLDNEIVDAMTLDSGNLPDLTEEQTPSLDESTRRDEMWSDGIMHIETLRYLNNIIRYNPQEAGARIADRDWVFYSETNGNCEHMHLALKFWNYLVLPYPNMREVVASGQVRCYCNNCHPDIGPPFAGWVRIERAHGEASHDHGFWHVLRSTLVSAAAVPLDPNAPERRPAAIGDTPCTNPSAADIWFDEEGKPHHTVLALDIDYDPNADSTDDRLLAYMIYLRSHITFNDDSAHALSSDEELS